MASERARRVVRVVVRVLAALMVGGSVLGMSRYAPDPPEPQGSVLHDVGDDGT
jgi:hypothetical protein